MALDMKRKAMNEAAIRVLQLEDYDAIVSLWQSSEGIGLSEADEREPLAGYLERNPGMSLVAEVDGRIVGAVLCGHDGRRGYLHHLAVSDAYRGHGIGSRLVTACVDNLRRFGIRKCHVFVYPDNEQGLHFWRRMDFEARTDIQLCSRNF